MVLEQRGTRRELGRCEPVLRRVPKRQRIRALVQHHRHEVSSALCMEARIRVGEAAAHLDRVRVLVHLIAVLRNSSQQHAQHASDGRLPFFALPHAHREQLEALRRSPAHLRVRLDEHTPTQVQLHVYAREHTQQLGALAVQLQVALGRVELGQQMAH
jgi:hypothetical protein